MNASSQGKANAGRFLYMPRSDFTGKGKKKHEVHFKKSQPRHPDKFLGIDLREYKSHTTPQIDLDAMQYQVG